MTGADWIVVGAGLAGSALGYELAKAGFSVLLLDQQSAPPNATRYSYGGIAYWSGTTDVTQTLCRESMELHRNLSAELEGDTQFRELDLLLTIQPGRDLTAVAASYSTCLIPPEVISAEDASAMEPLLNRSAIAAALHVCHGHVEPELTAKAYRQAMLRLGGRFEIGTVQGFVKAGDRIQGVITDTGTYSSANVVVCAGGLSRTLLRSLDITVPLYYTQAEVLDTHPPDVRLRTLVMPAQLQRFAMEADAGNPEKDVLWDQPGQELIPAILDVGAIQFADGRLRIGQISRVLTDPTAMGDPVSSEAELRAGVGEILPMLKDLPGQWGGCLVAFSGDRLPLVGALSPLEGIHLFSGFSNPFALLPPLARRFANYVSGKPDAILERLSPMRFR